MNEPEPTPPGTRKAAQSIGLAMAAIVLLVLFVGAVLTGDYATAIQLSQQAAALVPLEEAAAPPEEVLPEVEEDSP